MTQLANVVFQHPKLAKQASFSPDSTKIVTADCDEIVRIWDVSTGLEIQRLIGHEAVVHHASFSPNGSKIVTVCRDNIRIWDALTGQEIHRLSHDNAEIAIFSHNGATVITAWVDVRIWNVESGREIHRLTASLDDCELSTLIDISPDSSKIVTVDRSSFDCEKTKYVRIWDASTGEPLYKLVGHDSSTYIAKFSPDSSKLAVASHNETTIWNTQTGQIISNVQRGMKSMDFSPDGFLLLCIDLYGPPVPKFFCLMRETFIESLPQRRNVIGSGRHDYHGVKFSPDGSLIVAIDDTDNTCCIWNSQTGQQTHKFAKIGNRELNWLNCANVSPDGLKIVTVCDNAVRMFFVEK